MTAIIIGRFQVPHLHVGHLHLIATALRECDRVVILLGSQKSIDARNPYTTIQRTTMIRRIFRNINIMVIWDNPSDEEWSKEIDSSALMFDNGENLVLYHSRDSFKDHYHGKLPLKEVEEIAGYSGTKLREKSKNMDREVKICDVCGRIWYNCVCSHDDDE